MSQSKGLYERLTERLSFGGHASYVFAASLLAIAVPGLLALLLEEPLIFPSLGLTVYLFFETPMAKADSPRNATLGHFVEIAVGLLAFAIFGLLDDLPSAPEDRPTPSYVAAGALSVALTGLLQLLTGTWHPLRRRRRSS